MLEYLGDTSGWVGVDTEEVDGTVGEDKEEEVEVAEEGVGGVGVREIRGDGNVAVLGLPLPDLSFVSYLSWNDSVSEVEGVMVEGERCTSYPWPLGVFALPSRSGHALVC